MKLRITVTAVVEYEPKPENYPEGQRTLEEMLALDLESAKDDTYMFLDTATEWNFAGEILK